MPRVAGVKPELFTGILGMKSGTNPSLIKNLNTTSRTDDPSFAITFPSVFAAISHLVRVVTESDSVGVNELLTIIKLYTII